MTQTFDLNYNVETTKGAKRHYGFHINAESKEEAEANLAADLKQVVAQCAAPAPKAPAAGKGKAGKTGTAAKPAAPKAKAPAKAKK